MHSSSLGDQYKIFRYGMDKELPHLGQPIAERVHLLFPFSRSSSNPAPTMRRFGTFCGCLQEWLTLAHMK